jgi:uncharacterized membrane protein YdbT with pleckstrin-like domain
MSETSTEAPAAVPEPATAEPTVSELAGKVDRLIDLVTPLVKPGEGGGEGGEGGEAEAPSVAAEVKRELEKLKRAEMAKAERDAEKGKLADLEEKVKKVTEKQPREYRRSTRFMRWAGDDE